MPITKEQHQDWLKNRSKGALTSKLIVRSPAGNVLLVKPTFRETWQLPGGSVELHETPLDTAIRETREELGVEVDREYVSHVGYVPRDGYTIIIYEYQKPVAEDVEYRLHSHELADYKFEHPSQVASLLGSYYGEFWAAYSS